jgi:hypothetical protein
VTRTEFLGPYTGLAWLLRGVRESLEIDRFTVLADLTGVLLKSHALTGREV